MTTFKPQGTRILVRRADTASTTDGGIALPDSAKSKRKDAEIVAIGDNILVSYPDFRVGAKVLVPEYGGAAVEINDETLYVYNVEDVLGTFHETPDTTAQ